VVQVAIWKYVQVTEEDMIVQVLEIEKIVAEGSAFV